MPTRDAVIARATLKRPRDAAILDRLQCEGWRALTPWECRLGNLNSIAGRVLAFLESEERHAQC